MEQGNFINGQWQQGKGNRFSSICPLKQSVIWQGNAVDEAQILQAKHSAKNAFSSWSELTLCDRVSYLETYADLLTRDKNALALLISKDVGKPLWEAKTEISAMVSKISISIKSYHQRTGMIEQDSVQLSHRAHGVLLY